MRGRVVAFVAVCAVAVALLVWLALREGEAPAPAEPAPARPPIARQIDPAPEIGGERPSAVPVLALAAPGAAHADSIEDLMDRLPEDRREQFEAALERLAPEQRAKLVERYEQLSPDQREIIERSAIGAPPIDPVAAQVSRQRENEKRWAQLSEGEREAMRQQLRDFQALSEADQDALVDTTFARRTADKRREMLNRLRKVRLLH
jgi:hypothetical protein